ncbi:MAG TPA: hypothetical protein GX392_01510 [Clostridiales bacterium]|nr:hypothetical protein [Clostridiales bacterium]
MDKKKLSRTEGTTGLSLSDNVIMNRERLIKAIALRYDHEKDDSAPKVVAKGQGHVASKMIERAKKHGISVVEDGRLVDSLMSIPIGQQIPTELYEAVAQIYVYLAKLDEKVGEGRE